MAKTAHFLSVYFFRLPLQMDNVAPLVKKKAVQD